MDYVKVKGKKFEVKNRKLDLRDKKIEKIIDIEGLENLSNLENLNLSKNNIKEIKGLENLLNLIDLGLDHNEISEIKGLDNLYNLKYLNLAYNKINEIKNLENLIYLIDLGLDHNKISEIKGLDNLINLDYLWLQNNCILDLKGLDKVHCEFVYLNENKIKTLENIGMLRNIFSLELGSNEISEINGLHRIQHLSYLGLNNNNIKEIKGLSKLKFLGLLQLGGNEIKKIKGLENLNSLEKFNIIIEKIPEEFKSLPKELLVELEVDKEEGEPDGQVFVRYCRKHKEKIHSKNNDGKVLYKSKEYYVIDGILDLSNQGIESINEIQGFIKLSELKELNLSKNKIEEIEGLEALKNLEVLDLSDNKIREIKGIDSLINLKELYFGRVDGSGNEIKVIKGIEKLVNLEVLDFSHCEVREITGLDSFVNLKILSFLGNINILEIKGLDNLKELRVLNLASTGITEVKGLDMLKKLNELYFGIGFQNPLSSGEEWEYGTAITSIKGLDNLKLLKILDVSNCSELREVNLKNPSIKILYIENVYYKILKHIQGFPNLDELYLYYNEIESLKGFEKFPNLRLIDLRENPIEDFKGLDKLEHLQYLWLSHEMLNLDEKILKKFGGGYHLTQTAQNHAERIVNYCIKQKLKKQMEKEAIKLYMENLKIEQEKLIFKETGTKRYQSKLKIPRDIEKLGKKQTDYTVEELISDGEGPRVEFKSSLRWDYKQNSVNKELEHVVLKEISGFLNSNGGILLIGVDDNGIALGLEKDYKTLRKKNKDGFSNHLVQLIGNYIGEEFGDYWRIKFLQIEDKEICVLEADKSPHPVYLKTKGREEFYIRKGTSTRPLSIHEALKYIEHHFNNV